MHSQTTPVGRKRLVDPAACGIRLGVELRAAAERRAYISGMCLSHWIKHVVEEALRRDQESSLVDSSDTTAQFAKHNKSDGTELNLAYEHEMEKLNDR